MRVALPDWTALALFAATVLAVALYALAVSGHFPAEHRRASLGDRLGGGILWGTIAVAACAGGVAAWFAWWRLPGYAAVIAGGLAVLAAPMVLQAFPDRFIDGRRGLVAFALAAAVLSAAAVVART